MFTDNQIQILALLSTNPNKEYYFSEIGNILKKKPGVFQRSLNSLEKEGVITSRKRGNQRLLKINKNYPFYEEVKSIIRKIGGAEGLLKDLVEKFKDIETAFIYGSFVRDKLRADSDIDLVLIINNTKFEDPFLAALEEIENKLQREINYKIYFKTEFTQKQKLKDPFLEEILNDKYILLKGML